MNMKDSCLCAAAVVCLVSLLHASAQSVPKVECPSRDPNGNAKVPHPTDCSQYFMCVYGTPVLMPCPAGLHFSSSKQDCDYPEDAKCERNCDILTNDAGGSWTPPGCALGVQPVGSKCTLQCNNNFTLRGSSYVQCTDNGWNSSNGNTIPKCITTHCLSKDLVDEMNKTLSVNAGLLFVLDESGSVGKDDFEKTKGFVKDIINKFPLSANRSAGVITFDAYSIVRVPLKESSTSSFMNQVDAINYRGGNTNILEALQNALIEINTNHIHPLTLVFLVTDGISETDGTPASVELKANNNPLFTIGVGQTILEHLEALSSIGTNGIKHFFHTRDYGVLKSIGKYINPPAGSSGSNANMNCTSP